MSFKAAQTSLSDYRRKQISTMLGEEPGTWFTAQWDDVDSMLRTFSTDEENSSIAGKYAKEAGPSRVADHIRLDYVCALRRDVRKQYVSEDSGICTDVTPFRHGIISAHGAAIFDDLLNTVIEHAERQAEGG